MTDINCARQDDRTLPSAVMEHGCTAATAISAVESAINPPPPTNVGNANYELSVVEDATDERSPLRAIRLIVKNSSPTTINIDEIHLHPPAEATVQRTSDFGTLEIESEHSRLCQDLSIMFTDAITFSVKSIKEAREREFTEFLRGLLRDFSGSFGFLKFFVKSVFQSRSFDRLIRQRWADRNRVFNINIRNYSDCIAALEYLESSMQEKAILSAVRMKMRLLQAREEDLGPATNSRGIAAIAPRSEFTRAYVIRFPQSKITPRVFGLHFLVLASDGIRRFPGGRSTSFTVHVSADPKVLTFLAGLFGMGGAILRRYADKASVGVVSPLTLNSDLLELLSDHNLIVGAGLAVIVMQVFEKLMPTTTIERRLGWPSALFVGMVVGLFNKNFLAALGGLVGAGTK